MTPTPPPSACWHPPATAGDPGAGSGGGEMQRRKTFLITGKIFGLSSWHLPTTSRAMQAARRGSGSGLQNAVGLLLSWDGVENCTGCTGCPGKVS